MATGIHKTHWNGEVLIDNPVGELSDSTIDLELHYSGKSSLDSVLCAPPAEILPVWYGTGTTNRLYFGDNLSVMATLLRDSSVRGQVKLVYIDPPFATDKIYSSRKQTEAYSDLLLGAHYIEFLRRRLILLRELLAEDGSIYVHLDQNMIFHVKIIMDEIFGERNFRSFITRQKCNPKNYTRRSYGNISDHILYYSKSDNPIWNRPYIPWTTERLIEEYPYIEQETGRRYKKVPIHAPGIRRGATGQPWRGMLPPPGKHWQYTPARLEQFDAQGEIYWSPNGNPRRKVYLDQSEGIPVQDIWLDMKDAHNQMIKVTGYPTEKPLALLSRIIQASSNDGDLILDSFAGSGTTLVAAAAAGRRWIGIDNSSEAIASILTRFANGMQPMGDFVTASVLDSAKELPLFEALDSQEPHTSNTIGDRNLYGDVITDFVLYSVATHKERLCARLDLAEVQKATI